MAADALRSDTVEPPGTETTMGGEGGCLSGFAVDSVSAFYPHAGAESHRLCGQRGDQPGKSFRLRWYPGVSRGQWNDWRWQYAHRIRRFEDLDRMFLLTPSEREAFGSRPDGLPLAITPYYASLIHRSDATHPIRRAMIPVAAEADISHGEEEDPLDESRQSPVPGLVHRYADRVLFLVTNRCAAYCRYCTRSRVVGRDGHGEGGGGPIDWEERLAYIRQHTEIRDVLLSGGDPLMLPDEALEWLLSRLRAIKHVEIIRIGTKAPVVLPQRITPSLIRVLRRYHPLWMSIHFMHPFELTAEVETACTRLADAGIPLGSQTVLLAGVNDEPATMKTLFHGLLRLRVRPYYLYQCDPVRGTAHFRTPVSRGVEIIRSLRGHTSGYAVPHFVIDSPGGGGKVPVAPDYLVAREADQLILQNHEGRLYRYPDTASARTE